MNCRTMNMEECLCSGLCRIYVGILLVRMLFARCMVSMLWRIVIDNNVDVLAELKPKYKGKLTLPRIQGSLYRLQAPSAVRV